MNKGLQKMLFLHHTLTTFTFILKLLLIDGLFFYRNT